MNTATRRTLTGVVVVFSIALASGVLGYWAGSQPFTEFGNLAVVFYGLVMMGASLLLLVGALLVGLLRRRLGWPLLLIGIAGALFVGFSSGVRLHEALCCGDGQPDPVRTVALYGTLTLGSPSEATVELAGECTVDTASDAPPGIRATAEIAGVTYDFMGVPPATPSSDEPFDSFDVMVFDGERGWGYRPTDWQQVEVFLTNRLQGITRLNAVPLLADTRPVGLEVPNSLSAELGWRCAIDEPL